VVYYCSAVHRNELLSIVDPKYASTTRQFQQTSHTVATVLKILKDVAPPTDWAFPSGIDTGADVFVGYLALDALIGNTDRHHENWGIIGMRETAKVAFELAPTFDHASSLGCHETDEKKNRRLNTADANFGCEAYASRARSGFFDQSGKGRPLRTIEAFKQAAQLNPSAAKVWRSIVDKIGVDQLTGTIGQIPESVMSGSSRAFAVGILKANRRAILGQ
jgi:hypothetical protein